MKDQLKLVRPAVAGNEATVLTSRMVKIQDGRMWAYGGAFCISIPFAADVQCAFRPEPVEAFFKKDRPELSLTVIKGRMHLRSGKAEIAVPVLPATDMPVLAVLGGDLQEFPENLSGLRHIAKNCIPGCSSFRQGLLFRGGVAYGCHQFTAMRGDGIDIGEDCCITPEAAAVIASNTTKIVRVSVDRQAVEFEFADQMIVACRRLRLAYPATLESVFNGDAVEVGISYDFLKEASGFNATSEVEGKEVDTVWEFDSDGSVSYHSPNGDTGRFNDAYTPSGAGFRINGRMLASVVSAGSGVEERTFLLLPSPADPDKWNRLMLVTEKFEFVGALAL